MANNVKQADVDKVTQKWEEKGFILGETFGYRRGGDGPVGPADANIVHSEIWYIDDTGKRHTLFLRSYITAMNDFTNNNN